MYVRVGCYNDGMSSTSRWHYLNVIKMVTLSFKVLLYGRFAKMNTRERRVDGIVLHRARHIRVTYTHLSSRFQRNYKLLISLVTKMCDKVYNETLSIQRCVA